MRTIRSGASGWIDEHQISAESADQLFLYIQSALEYVEQNGEERPEYVEQCGEPVPFRDPEGQYECVLIEGHEGTHATRLFNADRQKWLTYRWAETE